jgi:hypothetical protein
MQGVFVLLAARWRRQEPVVPEWHVMVVSRADRAEFQEIHFGKYECYE